MTSPVQFSETFRVGGMALWHRLPINGFGTLTVSSDRGVVFRPVGVTRRLTIDHDVVHREDSATMVKAIVCPPWIATFIVVCDRDRTVLVGILGSPRRRLRRAFAQAGIPLLERWAWSVPVSSLYRSSSRL